MNLQFFHEGITEAKPLKKIQRILFDIWGATRKIGQSVTINPSESMIYNVISIELDRLVGKTKWRIWLN